MSTVEDFENAPVGATATRADGHRAMKIDDGEQRWIIRTGLYMDDEELMILGYTLKPPAPTTAREALDLAWDLAHEVKEGQVIPKGAQYLEYYSSGMEEYTAGCDFKITPALAPLVRTLEPLPDPEPDWIDAPAVLAYGPATNLLQVWVKDNQDTGYYKTITNRSVHYVALNDATPLYPKGQDK